MRALRFACRPKEWRGRYREGTWLKFRAVLAARRAQPMQPADARIVWLSGLAVLIGALLVAAALSALSQLIANASTGTTRPGIALATLPGTRALLAEMRALVASRGANGWLVRSRPATIARERASVARAMSQADTLGIDPAAAAALATLLTACARQSRSSCRTPSELGGVLMDAWVGALAEWRRIGCAAAGSLVEEGLRENEDLQAPWPRMLSAALLSATPCALPAARTPHVGPFRVQAPS